MPIITMTMGPTTDEKKAELIEKLTATAVAVTELPAQYFTVVIDEKSFESLGVGGKTIAQMHKDGP